MGLAASADSRWCLSAPQNQNFGWCPGGRASPQGGGTGLPVTCPLRGTCAGDLGVASHATWMAWSAVIAPVSPMLELRLGLTPGHFAMVRAGGAPRWTPMARELCPLRLPGRTIYPRHLQTFPGSQALARGRSCLYRTNGINQNKRHRACFYLLPIRGFKTRPSAPTAPRRGETPGQGQPDTRCRCPNRAWVRCPRARRALSMLIPLQLLIPLHVPGACWQSSGTGCP